MRIRWIACLAAMPLTACQPADDTGSPSGAGTEHGVDAGAREYLFLELAMGRHDPAHVDAYFGPDDIKAAADQADLALDQIRRRAADLATRLRDDPAAATPRVQGLLARLEALEARIDLNNGVTRSFDDEAMRLFGTRAPDYDATDFDAVLERIDELLPGDGELSARVEAFVARFAIPADKLAAVFDAAIAECRRRTLEHIALPEHESFTLEYVTHKPWSGYNWYQGGAQSLIQINTDLPIFLSRAVDLGCHEGYPGHHTFNALLEKNLVDEAGWIEFSLYPLWSPQSLIAEGSGNYGIDLAFPGTERIEFEKNVLFPLAGLDASEADRYYELRELLRRLSYADNEAARDYLNGDISKDEAVDWLIRYKLTSPERARQRVDFIETYRSYVINYNLGQDMVRNYVEQSGDEPAARWAAFEELLSTPMLPADLE